MTNPEVVIMLNLVKDALGDLARAVYAAQEDGKISWAEALALTGQASIAVLPIIGAFKSLSQASVKEFLDALADSDLVLRGK